MIEMRVKSIIKEQGMSVTELAKRLCISRQSASAIVNNRHKTISSKVLSDLMMCLHVTPNELFKGYGYIAKDKNDDAQATLDKVRSVLDE